MLSVGAKLTGTSDPYGLRRAAAGIVAILREHADLTPITIPTGVEFAAARLRQQGIAIDDSVLGQAEELIRVRLDHRLREQGVEQELRDAVRSAAKAPHLAAQLIEQIRAASTDPRFPRVVELLQRIMRILPAGTEATYDADRLTGDAEQAVIAALTATPSADGDLASWIDNAGGLIEPLQRFFDEVLVMAENPRDRAARLGLLARVIAVSPADIDWRELHRARGQHAIPGE
jgi:glycyl-tRNA synthetase